MQAISLRWSGLFVFLAVLGVVLCSSAAPVQAQTVSTPAGGDIWHYGEHQTIAWNGFTAKAVRIDLLRGTSRILTIASSAANNGSYNWVVPFNQPKAANYRIRVTNVTGSQTATSGAFTIMPPVVTVTSPNGGETWRRNAAQTITWTTSASGGSVRIDLFRGNTLAAPIAASVPNNGSFSWRVPANCGLGNNYRVRITWTMSGNPSDFSDGNFTIADSTITVTYPNDSTVTFYRSNIYTITWNSLGDTGSRVAIDLYRGNTRTLAISSSAPNTGTYNWVVPGNVPLGNNFLIKVTSLARTTYADYSDQPFTIANPKNTGAVIHIDTPDGDPTSTNPSVVGNSEVVFNTSTPGVLTVHMGFRVQAGSVSGIMGKVRACITVLDDSVLTWVNPVTGAPAPWTGATPPPAGANTACGIATYNPATGLFEVDAVYTNLPTHNTAFGLNKIWAQVIDGGNVVAQDDQNIEVFYPRLATNNPQYGSGTRDDGPNWFYYWKTGGAIAVNPTPTSPVVLPGWEYEVDPTALGFYMPGEDHVNVCNGADDSDPGCPFPVTNKYTGITIVIGSGSIGIDFCSSVLAHEFLHKKFFDDWDALIAAAEADGNEYNDYYDDADDDGIPNGEEFASQGVNSSPSDPDTYNMILEFPGSNYDLFGDQEVRCFKIAGQNANVVDHTKEWASPGFNSCPPF